VSVNRHQPHVLVLPEDRANSELANGFHLGIEHRFTRRMQVLVEAGGWTKVRDQFKSDHIAEMEEYPERFMVLLIDLDGDENRPDDVRTVIPQHLNERVFVLGVFSEPEALKSAKLGSYETIGEAMAKDCRDQTHEIWRHELLRHNERELARLRKCVRPILFPPMRD